jgi:hypothetical protein
LYGRNIRTTPKYGEISNSESVPALNRKSRSRLNVRGSGRRRKRREYFGKVPCPERFWRGLSLRERSGEVRSIHLGAQFCVGEDLDSIEVLGSSRFMQMHYYVQSLSRLDTQLSASNRH